MARGRVGLTKEDVVAKLAALVASRYGDSSIASQKKLWATYDKNHDGKLSKDELAQLLEDADACAWVGCGITAGKVIEAVDKDGDGLISWPEYALVAGIVEPAPKSPGAPPPPAGPNIADILKTIEAGKHEFEHEHAATEIATPLAMAQARAQNGDHTSATISLVSAFLTMFSLAAVAR